MALVAAFAGTLVYSIVASNADPSAGDVRSIRVASSQAVMTADDQPKAVLSLYEDLLCPACSSFEATFAETISQMIDIGAVVVDYTLVATPGESQPDSYSLRAGGAAYCVADQSIEAFRRFRGALYAEPPKDLGADVPGTERLIETARLVGADSSGVANCISRGRYTDLVQGQAVAAGIVSTPTVRLNGTDLNLTTPQELVARVRRIVGDVPGLDTAAQAGPSPG